MPRVRPLFVVLVAIISTLFLIDIGLRIRNSQNNSSATQKKLASIKPCPVCPNGLSTSSSSPLGGAPPRKANAAVVILARNSDLEGLKQSLPQFESRFNKKFQYPYVFLNEVPFSEEFKAGVKSMISGPAQFGLIPEDQWSLPKWIDPKKAQEARENMGKANIIYGDSLPYRHMCRYNSGFFFRHPLLSQYDYYWRVEPGVDFTCDINYDPFLFMQDNDKEYGFTIMLPEYEATIPTLWETTKKFMKKYPNYVHPRNVLKEMFTKEDGGYNLCHFWSNFEIASLKFLRSEAYLKYFEHLDRAGGFFYERWGDAPVHSIAAGMFLPKEKIHFFEDIGYFHAPYGNCPANPALNKNCQCDSSKSVHWGNSCQARYVKMFYP